MSRVWDKYLAAFIVTTAVVVLSFESLRGLAVMCGFSEGLSYLWPLALDATAYYATRVWLEHGAQYRYARTLALISIVLSVVSNAGFHAMQAYSASPHWTVVVLVGAVPPAALAPMVHLLASQRVQPVLTSGTLGTAGTNDRDAGTTTVLEPVPAVLELPAPGVRNGEGGTAPGTVVTAAVPGEPVRDADRPASDQGQDAQDEPQDADRDATRDDQDAQDAQDGTRDENRDGGTDVQDEASQDDPLAVLRRDILAREDETGTLPTANWCKQNLRVGHATASRVLREIKAERDGTTVLRAVGE